MRLALVLLLLSSCATPAPAVLPSLPTVPERPLHVARSNGIELAWDAFGDRAAPPLLLIMGLGLPAIAWDDDFCQRLAARGFYVVRFDNRDVGHSTHLDAAGDPNVLAVFDQLAHHRSPVVPYRLEDLAEDAVGLLDALAIDRAHVVGVSMGGMIAQRMAIAHPDRVRTLTSIMSNTGDSDVRGPSFEMLTLLRPMTADSRSPRDRFIERGVAIARGLAGGGFPVDVAAARSLAARSFDGERGGYREAGLHRQLAAIVTAPGRRDALAHLKLPALVIHGAADPLIPVDGGRATAQAIPGARLDIIAGMGHELPRAVWDRVIDDIAQLAR